MLNTLPKVPHSNDLGFDGFTVRDIAERLGLKTYDTAIPMQFTEDVFNKLGVSIWAHGIVWCYDQPKIWGEPYPLTYEANLILWIYSKITGVTFHYAIDPKEF